MNEEEPQHPAGGKVRKERKLNRSLIKSIIVIVVGACNALASALTGIGAHITYAPMLTWMLGFSSAKAQGSALNYSVYASGITFLVTAYFQKNGFFLAGRGALVFIGATFGAMALKNLTPKPNDFNRKRLMQTLGLFIAIFVGREAGFMDRLNESQIHFALLHDWWQIALVGAGVGALTQTMGLVSGVILFPALLMLTGIVDQGTLRGLNAYEAVAICLFVVFLASLLPAWGYRQKKLIDADYVNFSFIGALIGGIGGGVLLTNLQPRFIVMFFAIICILLSGRELYRLFWHALPTEELEVETQTESAVGSRIESAGKNAPDDSK